MTAEREYPVTLDSLSSSLGLTCEAAAGLFSPAEIMRRAEQAGQPCDWSTVQALHAEARKLYDDLRLLEKSVLTRASPLLPRVIRASVKPSGVSLLDYQEWFGDRATQYARPGEVASMFSPAAYLAALYREASTLYKPDSLWHIDQRRPDLRALLLSQANMDTQVSALTLSNEISMALVQKFSGGTEQEVLKALSINVQSAGTPYHHQHARLRHVQQTRDPEFRHLRSASLVVGRLSGQALAGLQYDISPGLYRLLTDEITEDNAEQKYTQYFGAIHVDVVLQPQMLRQWYGLTDEEVVQFFNASDLPDDGTDELNTLLYVLKLNKTIRLYRATGLSPLMLVDILNAVNAEQITDETLSLVFLAALLEKQYGVSHENALVMVGVPVSLSARRDELSHWDRTFNRVTTAEGGFTPKPDDEAKLHPDHHEKKYAADRAALRSACGVDDDGLYWLGRSLMEGEGDEVTIRFSHKQVSQLYALSLWARSLQLPPQSLHQLLTMLDAPRNLYAEPPAVWLVQWQRLSATVAWLDTCGWTVHDLVLMTREVSQLPASTEINVFLAQVVSVISTAEDAVSLSSRVAQLAPLVGAVFALNSETTISAVLNWASTADGLPSVEEFWNQLSDHVPGEPFCADAVKFAYGLAQRALIVHATGVSSDALALFSNSPAKLDPVFVDTLPCSLQMVQGLHAFSRWLSTRADAAGEVLSALAGEGLGTAQVARTFAVSDSLAAQAMNVVHSNGDSVQPGHLQTASEIQVLGQWLDLSDFFRVSPRDVQAMLELNKDYTKDSTPADTWDAWSKVADAFNTGLDDPQRDSVHERLAEGLSAALCGYLLMHRQEPDGLPYLVQNREALFRYLLMDNLNAAQVKSSRVAEAIASLQLLIHRVMSLAPGTASDNGESADVQRTALDRQFFRDWTQWNARFSTWAGGQKLAYYPENYIDPTVRLGQTTMMDDMLQKLGQAQINTDTVGDAFLGYLAGFEEVANLETISGYHDSRVENAGKVWFVGRSHSQSLEYWWRTLDESKRSAEAQLPANAWTGWTPITCAPQPLGNLIRPVVFRGRMYLGWIERTEEVVGRDATGGAKQTVFAWSLKLSMLRYDGGWSVPNVYRYPNGEMGSLDDYLKAADKEPTDLGFYLGLWPDGEIICVAVYRKDQVHQEANPFIGERAVYEDFSVQKTSLLSGNLAYIQPRLDTSTTTAVLTPLAPQAPVAEQAFSSETPRPGGFTNFDVTHFRAQIVDVKHEAAGTSFRVKLDLNVYVDCLRPSLENPGLRFLVNKFPELHDARPAFIATSPFSEQAAYIQSAEGFAYFRSNRTPPYARLKDHAAGATFYGPRKDLTVGPVHVFKFPIDAPAYNPIFCTLDIDYGNRIDYDRPLTNDFQDFTLAPLSGYVGPVPGPVKKESVRLWVAQGTANYENRQEQDTDYDNWARNGVSVRWSGTRFPRFDSTLPFTMTGNETILRVKMDFPGGFREWTLLVRSTGTELVADLIDRLILPDFPRHGSAQYLEHRSGVRTRLNTLFARKLTEQAQHGIAAILNFDTQQVEEPPLYAQHVSITFSAYDRSIHGDGSVDFYYVLILDDKELQSRPRYLAYRATLDLEGDETVITLPMPELRGKVLQQTDALYIAATFGGMPETGSYTQWYSFKFVAGTRRYSGRNNQHKIPGTTDAQLIGPPLSQMDFAGANAIYFWELYYYTPMMVMQRFLSEERYDLAEQWLKYIFSPSGYSSGGQSLNRLWNVRPLHEDTTWNDRPLQSYDPDAVAQNDPMHYKVNAFMRLLDIIIGRGDTAYRKLERDTLVEAKVWYGRALDLLGEAPWIESGADWASDTPTLERAAEDRTLAFLTAFNQLSRGQRRPADGMTVEANAKPLFLPEANEVMLGYWETLRIRLYNLRHNLTLDGRPLNLPLFAAPANPKALLAAAVAAESGAGGTLPPDLTYIPALRFTPLLESARSMASQLVQFGSSMQQILISQDGEALAELLATQGAAVAANNVSLHLQTLEELAAERATLTVSLDAIRVRLDHYEKLHEENISGAEQAALLGIQKAVESSMRATTAFTAGAVIAAAPNIFGVANGGHQLGQIAYAAGYGIQTTTERDHGRANRLITEEQYRRRRQDWDLQRKIARAELDTVEAQLKALEIRRRSSQMQVDHMETLCAQAQAQLALFHDKFAGKAMYSWLRGRLATIFYQYYDLTASMCLMAQQALQWEKGDETRYLKTGTWTGAWAGLMSGEGLMLSLAQMEVAWTKHQKRDLEVTRSVSLAQVYAALYSGDSLQDAVRAILSSGTPNAGDGHLKLMLAGDELGITFDLSELKLMADFSTGRGRVRSIAVTLPALLGPYQSVRGNMYTTTNGLPAGCERCAISSAMHDNGLFPADGHSDPRASARWLPFEGLDLGVKSNMTLSFADATDAQKALLESLTDIILHIQYTVR